MGNENQPEVIGALRRLTFAERHGKHVGQEGVEGQAGGSAPGFTHAESGVAANKIGVTSDTWTKQPFDESLANKYANAIQEKYGLADKEFVNATWIAPDGRAVGEGNIHEDTSRDAIIDVHGQDIDDFTITETQVIQAGLIRHVRFSYGQDSFIISGIDTLTDQQKNTIKAIVNARVDQMADAEVQEFEDRYRVGLRLFVVENIPPSLDNISRELGKISSVSSIRLLEMNKNEWRPSIDIDGDDQLVVSKAPRRNFEGNLEVERAIMPDFEIDIDEISYDWVSGLKDSGVHTVPIEPKDGIIAMPRARVEPKEEEVEKKSLLKEVRRSLSGLLEAIADQYSGVAQQADVARHGQHIGQEGRKGESGGSEPGFTHAEGDVSVVDSKGRLISMNDPDLAQNAIDFLVEKYGEAAITSFGDMWLGPDGRLAEVGWHAEAAVRFLESENKGLLFLNYGGEETLSELERGVATVGALDLTDDLIERGLIRIKVKPKHSSVAIQGSPPMTNAQKLTIQDIIVQMPKDRKDLQGRTGFQWDFRKPGETNIRWKNQGFDVADFYRAAGIVERSVERHGKHIGQEGVEGQAGGSAPGFTHGEGVATADGSTNVDELGNKVGEIKTLYGPNWDAGDDFILVKLDEYDGENWDVEVISGPSRENIIDFVGPSDLDEPHDDLLETWTSIDPIALEDRARDIFGLTDNIAEAGWLLDNGDMLDFSGKREGGSAGVRNLDHRDIGRAFLDDEATDLITINYFADQTRAMRVSYFGRTGEESTNIDIYRKPTQAQWDIVREMVSLSEDLTIDITDPSTASVIWSIQEDTDLDRALREARAQAAMKLKSMSALTLTFRHGKHIDQEGREGEGKGGSQPGFTHAEGSVGGAGAEPSGAKPSAGVVQPTGARQFRELTDKEINTIKDAKNVSREEIEKILEEAGWLGVEEETDYGQEVEQVASDLIEEAKVFEPEVTELMEGAAEEHDGEMAGLDFRLKGEKSYSRKIAADMEEKGISADEAARAVNDRVRYTMLFDGDEYAEKVLDVQESLAEDGYVQYDTKWKNYFRSGDPYDGYNTVMENPETGARFELQFHTPETIDIKFKAHVIYEAFQASEEGSPMRKVFYDAMTDLWTGYEKPDNWENLPGVLK